MGRKLSVILLTVENVIEMVTTVLHVYKIMNQLFLGIVSFQLSLIVYFFNQNHPVLVAHPIIDQWIEVANVRKLMMDVFHTILMKSVGNVGILLKNYKITNALEFLTVRILH